MTPFKICFCSLHLTSLLLHYSHSFINSNHYTYFPAELFSLNYRHEIMRLFLFSTRLICKPLKYTTDQKRSLQRHKIMALFQVYSGAKNPACTEMNTLKMYIKYGNHSYISSILTLCSTYIYSQTQL
jgi:hypothetical protein